MGMAKASPARAANPKVVPCSTPCSPCRTEFIASHFGRRRLKPSLTKLGVGSWNVDGCKDTKLEQFLDHNFTSTLTCFC